jgi:glycosyltransferase involved in cell wall biosynthesis
MNKVAFLVNGEPGGAIGERARAFADRLGGRYDVRLVYRSRHRVRSLLRFLGSLVRLRPALSYVFDMAYSGVAAAVLYRRLAGNRLVIDTGDAITALARSLGRGPLGLRLTRWLEDVSLAEADLLVVRGSYHREWLARRGVAAEVIPDGVDTRTFLPRRADDLRRRYGLEGMLTIGLVGSAVWSERLQLCYGWDLIEVIRLLRDRPVRGVLIGDGSGIPVLKARCREYGIEDRMHFLGRVSFEELPCHLGLIDVCLSTQTDDLVGRVRTTGKLPLYLACGRYVLASRVGEAARLLDDEMLVEYHGTLDPAYPRRLAERLERILEDRSRLDRARPHVELARTTFDYDVLAGKLVGVLDAVLGGRPRAAGAGRLAGVGA